MDLIQKSDEDSYNSLLMEDGLNAILENDDEKELQIDEFTKKRLPKPQDFILDQESIKKA